MIHQSAEYIVFTWGRFKGHSLAHVARSVPSYLEWMSGQHGLPEQWRIAAAKTLMNEDVSELDLPRTNNPTFVNNVSQPSTGKVEVILVDKKTAAVIMPYDKQLLARFKYEIDGRKWNNDEKHWEFPIVHLPKVFTVFSNIKCTQAVLDIVDELKNRRQDLDTIRSQEDTDFDIQGMKLALYPYQKVGVQFVDRADGRCLIADAPGLGKTAQAIGYAQLHNLKTIIVCPLSVVINWQREILKFTGKKSTIWDSKGYEGSLKNQFHICHYDAVAKAVQWLRDEKFDLLVCDEATYLKNRQTIRAKSILGSYKERRKYPGIKTKYSIFLTGTPVMSRPIEAFSLLNFLDKDRFNNFYHFVERYGGWKGETPRNLQDLHDRTKDLVIRRRKDEVLKELPRKQRNDLYVELTKPEMKEYGKLLQEVFGKWKLEGRPSVAHMPKLQGFLIDKKLPRVIEMIDELLDNDMSVLVYSGFKAPLHQLVEHYKDKAALLTGDMNKKDRQVTIDNLVSGKVKVGCFSIMAGGMGIDGLQKKINNVIFLDLNYVPANHEQAEDRCHRIHQKEQVQVFYMICPDTIDEIMREILKEKQAIADVIVDGALMTPDNTKSFFKEFVRRLNTSFDAENAID